MVELMATNCPEDESGDESNFVAQDHLLMVDSIDKWKELTCIEYPGIVTNDIEALKTLGGIESITKASLGIGYNRLELKYRPDDNYCKPVLARQTTPCCLALKIKRRKKKKKQSTIVENSHSNTDDHYEYSAEMVGVVEKLFEFTGMADFQLLPPGLNNMSHKQLPVDYNVYQLTELYDESVLYQDLPDFIPPISVISKLDKPANYCYKPDQKHNVGAFTDRPVQQIPGRARMKRPNFAYGISFDHKGDIPSSPKPFTPNSNHPKLPALKQLFEERPVWSRGAMQARLKITSVMCKQLVPLVAYNFTSGPWRTLWVKFGYDPRTSPDGKKYQCLDFRVPKILEQNVVAASKNYRFRRIRPLGVGGETDTSWKMGMLHQEEEKSMKKAQERLGENISLEEESAGDLGYIFDPDYLPQQRQQFYQLCDLHSDTLQAIISTNEGKEIQCNEVTGWCEEDTYDRLRKQIIEMIVSKAVKDGILPGKVAATVHIEDCSN